jgi:hypothetical protein
MRGLLKLFPRGDLGIARAAIPAIGDYGHIDQLWPRVNPVQPQQAAE